MDRREFRRAKTTGGLRLARYEFKESRKAKLPKHMEHIRRKRVLATDLIDVGRDVSVVFLWRTGDCLEKRALNGYAFRQKPEGLEPLLRMDYHPSHKGLHIKFNCEQPIEFINRDVVRGREFSLNHPPLDPDNAQDRARFVEEFCRRIAASLGEGDLLC